MHMYVCACVWVYMCCGSISVSLHSPTGTQNSVRAQHNIGFKHKANVRAYYAAIKREAEETGTEHLLPSCPPARTPPAHMGVGPPHPNAFGERPGPGPPPQYGRGMAPGPPFGGQPMPRAMGGMPPPMMMYQRGPPGGPFGPHGQGPPPPLMGGGAPGRGRGMPMIPAWKQQQQQQQQQQGGPPLGAPPLPAGPPPS